MDNAISDAQENSNTDLRSLCYDVKDFVLEGTFTNYKKVKMLLSYWGYPDNYVSKMTGMKEGTVRVARRNLSNELYELFGYDFFEVISIGDKRAISDGKARLDLVRKGFSADNFLYRDLIMQICSQSEVDDDIDVKDCAPEIRFLVYHSKQNIGRELARLNMNKLAYLIRMLNNETGTLLNIHNLIKCFEKEI